MKFMRSRGLVAMATYALLSSAGVTLSSGGVALAEGKPSTRDSASAKVEPGPPKWGEQGEHAALTRAHQSGMNQAQAAIRYVEGNSTHLDKRVLNRYTESIGRALDESQEHRQVLEKSAPEGGKAADLYQTMRDHEQSAAEHYRAFVLEVSKTKPDPDELKDEAEDMSDELKDAEDAHRKIFSDQAKAAEKSGQGQMAPGGAPGDGQPGLPTR
jgi:chromosome segregation ATPase